MPYYMGLCKKNKKKKKGKKKKSKKNENLIGKHIWWKKITKSIN